MKGKSFLALMASLILLMLLLSMILPSCYSSKKAEKAVSKALAYYPEQTIGKVRILAPCVTFGHSFSTDSAAYKAGIDSLYNTRGWYETLIRGIETLPPHPIQQDTLCPEMAKELIQSQKQNEWSEQYIISLTDQFNNLKPIIINRVDTIEDLAKVMELDLRLLSINQELKDSKIEVAQKEKSQQKWFAWTVRLGISSIILLLLLIAAIWLLIQKSKAKLL